MYHGTGTVIGVPAHNARDYKFAQKISLPITPVIENQQDHVLPFCENGILINSQEFSGLTTEEAKKRILKFLEEKHLGKTTVQYKLHNWLFSRQRYWGNLSPLFG